MKLDGLRRSEAIAASYCKLASEIYLGKVSTIAVWKLAKEPRLSEMADVVEEEAEAKGA